MLKAISLFTGIGGLDFGFEAAGFETAVAVEMDAVCCRTLRLNRRWPVIERRIHEVTSKELLDTAKLKARHHLLTTARLTNKITARSKCNSTASTSP